MSYLIWLGMVIVLTVIQTSLSPVFQIWGVTPDFLFLAVILGAVYGNRENILYIAPLIGYIKDLYSGGVIGVSFVIFFLVVYFIREERHRLDFDSHLLGIVVVAVTIAEGLLSFFLQQLIMQWEINWLPVFMKIMGHALYNFVMVEILRFLWKNFLEVRFLKRPLRRRFREL